MIRNKQISAVDNTRIAKNTMLLYVRMIVFMAIGFYTSRIILNALGVEDYGINNVVSGVVSMFTFVNGALTTATSRHITFALGAEDKFKLKDVFGTSLTIHGIMSLVVILLAETIGLWIFYNKMVIPEDRIYAAMWVYQISILSAVLNIMSVPYNATIIAHEKMSAFAWITIFDAVMKLAIVFLLVEIPLDKLIIYALLFFAINLSDQMIYMFYCQRNFYESRTFFIWNKLLIKEMSSFAGWSLYGNLSVACLTQGENILLNMFFGPVVNAARGIAIQTQAIVQRFIDNFQMALNPQITKAYASNEIQAMQNLMFRSSRFSFCLLLLLSLPVMFEANYILTVWLKLVPNDTVLFFRIIMCTSLFYATVNPVIRVIQATGKVKFYELVCGTINLMLLPIAYIMLTYGCPAYFVLIVHFILDVITQCIRLIILRRLINMSVLIAFRKVYVPVLSVLFVSLILPLIVHYQLTEGFVRFISVCVVSVISVSLASFYIGFQLNERLFVIGKFKSRVNSIIHMNKINIF